MGKYADRYFQVHPWKIIEEGFDSDYSQVAESIFSLGNEYTGLRGYFDEGYSGPRLQGSYLNGVYERRMLPKSGYKGMLPFTEFMVNTVDWVYTRISSGEQVLDLAKCRFSDFRRELDLRTGVLTRRFVWHIDEHTAVEICFERFTSMEQEQLVGQKLTLRAAKGSPVLTLRLGLDFTCPHVPAAVCRGWGGPHRNPGRNEADPPAGVGRGRFPRLDRHPRRLRRGHPRPGGMLHPGAGTGADRYPCGHPVHRPDGGGKADHGPADS